MHMVHPSYLGCLGRLSSQVICKHTQMRAFSILSPRWHDRRVLLASNRVGEHNKILFTGKDGASMGTAPYYISGKSAKRFKKESNSTIMCYSIPLDELQPLEIAEHCIHEY